MKKLFVVLYLVSAAFLASSPVQAASQSECAIWLCLPGGFPSGCSDARSALRDRIRDFKSPLPSFSSCADNPPKGSGSHMSTKLGVAAYIPSYDVCVRYQYSGPRNENRECVEWRTNAERLIRGVRCERNRDGDPVPARCTETRHWVEVFVEEEQLGPTHYYTR